MNEEKYLGNSVTASCHDDQAILLTAYQRIAILGGDKIELDYSTWLEVVRYGAEVFDTNVDIEE